MPITSREWEQIKVAIEAMSSIDLTGKGPMINRHNTLAILSRWLEEEKDQNEKTKTTS